MSLPIRIPENQIAAFCARHHIRRLLLFGSALRDDFRSDSDIDLLAEFASGHVPGFFGLIAMQNELQEMLGREVDFLTPGFLSRHIRNQVMQEALVIYDAA